MRVSFRLAWHKPGAPLGRAFKLPGASAAMAEYLGRVGRYVPCAAAGGLPEPRSGRVWLLDRAPGAKVLSSEDVAAALALERGRGTSRLELVVGGPDGFTGAQRRTLSPSLIWSFGPLTLPHELAAVVAAEQLYRAFTILNREPYHLAH